MNKSRKVIRISTVFILLIGAGYLLPERFTLPVQHMTDNSFHHQSFWYYPWGKSIRHKGVDIFAAKGKHVFAATSGLVISCGTHPSGGRMVVILGPKWHIHHYLHLDTIIAEQYAFVARGAVIGKVGNTGNAAHKPCHLHYAITTPIPYVWQVNKGIQGYKKMWYVDPTPYLLNNS